MLLYLLRPEIEGRQESIEIDGQHWCLAGHDLDAADAVEIPFTCVSYTWGTGRERSPFHSFYDVSDRTVPALNAVVRHRPSCAGIWIDAFCVPVDTPETAHTLASMGFIYSRADEVIVVLSSGARRVIEQMSTSDRLDPVHLGILEQEEWISSE